MILLTFCENKYKGFGKEGYIHKGFLHVWFVQKKKVLISEA